MKRDAFDRCPMFGSSACSPLATNVRQLMWTDGMRLTLLCSLYASALCYAKTHVDYQFRKVECLMADAIAQKDRSITVSSHASYFPLRNWVDCDDLGVAVAAGKMMSTRL